MCTWIKKYILSLPAPYLLRSFPVDSPCFRDFEWGNYGAGMALVWLWYCSGGSESVTLFFF